MHPNATIFSTGVALIFLSLAMLSCDFFKRSCRWLIFSRGAPVVTLGVGGIWFLINVLHLSVADFGEYRVAFFFAFGAIILLSFFKMRDLLAVRGLAVLLLVCADLMLDNVYGEQILRKNFFVSFVYLLIIFAMLIGAVPYLFRNLAEFLWESSGARLSCAAIAACYGVLLLWISFRVIG